MSRCSALPPPAHVPDVPGPSRNSGDAPVWTDVRLPEWISPTHYTVNITTRLSQATFDGTVDIALAVAQPSRFVVVHQVGLAIGDVELRAAEAAGDTPQPVAIERIEQRPDEQYFVVHLASAIPAGSYRLHVAFAGELKDVLEGFYRSRYTNRKDGTTEFLATTQFEPVHARRAFPCLDEPAKKAVFAISIAAEKQYHAISNMPAAAVTDLGNGFRRFEFEPTVRMSTYLVAFIVSNFESIEAKTKSGVAVRVWTQRKSTRLGEYALGVGVKVLDYFEQTYGIGFPLPKCDLIAIPDFQAGAMENWGLITFRDTALLFDPKKSSVQNQQAVAVTVAHELAHQWFGNLVTMKWWSDLWLNEGFAQFMEYKGTNAAEPNWQMAEQFLPSDFVRALNADESLFTHPIAIPVKNPDEIQDIFDDISYGKGASVLRMLEGWLRTKFGPDYFFSRLSTYLKDHSYTNAETTELWRALQGTDGGDLAAFMSTWTDQPGFPLVTVSSPMAAEGGADATGIAFEVSQRRYLFSGLVDPLEYVNRSDIPPVLGVPADPRAQTWAVPLTYALFSNSTGKPRRVSDPAVFELVERGPVRVAAPASDAADEAGKGRGKGKLDPRHTVVIANYGRTGMYRVQYDARTLEILLEWLQADLDVLTATERAGLLSDVFSLTLSGEIKDVTVALEFAKLLEREEDVIVWMTAVGDLGTLKKAFAHHPSYGLVVRFQRRLLGRVLRSLGWRETSKDKHMHHVRGLARATILQEAIRDGHTKTVAQAREYFAMLRAGRGDKVDVSPDVLGAVLVAGVMHGDESDYDWVLAQYLKSTFAADQQRYLFALASSPVSYLQMRTLNLTLTGEIRKQDITRLVENVASITPVGHLTAWIFLMDHWKEIAGWKAYAMTGLGGIIKDIVGKFTNSYLVSEAQRLFVDRRDAAFEVPPSVMVAVLKGLETSRQLVAWQAAARTDAAAWLRRELARSGGFDDDADEAISL
ncbi:Aminopeptidase 2 mitochondrial [Polyrhizophydium stewartii]|uniref:Aminopeptidase n=1 Tax=Polyrhizophydium stewartii TaxID=2732419 RepID=A0ABR4MWQ6_9FUNG